MTRKVARHFSLAGSPRLFLLLLLAVRITAVTGAEVRGTVTLEHIGLFGQAPETPESGPLSVAIFPLDGATPASGESKTHRVEIRDNQITPNYLAITRGDRVRFENHDDVHHELFSVSAENPFVLRLGKRGHAEVGSGAVQSEGSATWHVFCRIHARTYARIDVLDTPYIKMLTAGAPFAFHKLTPGRWRVRIATPGAETRTLEILARPAAPALKETLTVRVGAPGRQDTSARRIGIADLFPSEPGF
jgi:plastocyanin